MPAILKHWQTPAEYQHFISQVWDSIYSSQLKKLHSMSDSWDKLTSLNLGPVGEFLSPIYSNTGRPALNQPQILRSFVLMPERKFTSLTNWRIELRSDDLLAMLIGCSPKHLPPLGSYFDFRNRLWLRNPEFECSGQNDLFPTQKNLLPNPVRAKNFLTATLILPQKSLNMLSRRRIFLSITRFPCRNFFPLLPLSPQWKWD